MSIVPAGEITAGVAGLPLARTQGPEAERIRQDAADRHREIAAAEKAEAADGVTEPDGEDHQPEDRAADGRRPWEEPSANTGSSGADIDEPPTHSKDATGVRGNLLDLSG